MSAKYSMSLLQKKEILQSMKKYKYVELHRTDKAVFWTRLARRVSGLERDKPAKCVRSCQRAWQYMKQRARARPDVRTDFDNEVAGFISSIQTNDVDQDSTNGELGGPSTSIMVKKIERRRATLIMPPCRTAQPIKKRRVTFEDREMSDHGIVALGHNAIEEREDPQAGPNQVQETEDYDEMEGIQQVMRNEMHSSAQGTRNYLRVAITTEPFVLLNDTELEQILMKLEEELDKPITPSGVTSTSRSIPTLPSFRGEPHYSEGVLKLECEDDSSVPWLNETIRNVDSPRPGTRLIVKRQDELAKQAKILIKRYRRNDTLELLRERFREQNAWYDVTAWQFLTVKQEGSLATVELVVPLQEVPKIMERQCQVAYKFGSVSLSFVD